MSFSLLNILIKRNLGCPNTEYDFIFEHFHQNIRAYPRGKKICIDQWLWKYYCISGKVRAKRGVDGQVWFVPNTYRGSEDRCYPLQMWLFLRSSKFGNSIASTYTDMKLLYKYEHIFFYKTGDLIINWVSLFISKSIP